MSGKILILVLVIVSTYLTALSQTIVPAGNVSGIWTAGGSPYLIQGNITIQVDSTLTIEPGVKVNFEGNYTFAVNGILQAVGTAADSIRFTASTDWGGITFTNAASPSHLEYCILDSVVSPIAPIYCQNSNPIISHTTIRHNWGQLGSGGIYLENNSNPRLSYCTISNNSGSSGSGTGGGIRLANSSPEISYCSIVGNSGTAGGIACGAGSAPLISHSNINGNYSSSSHGGGISVTGANPLISNCTISGNKAYEGGGISFVNGGRGTITDCFITSDTADFQGGGIYISSSGGVVTIKNSTISNCYVSPTLSGGAGIYISIADTVSIVNTIIDANYTDMQGGAVYSSDCNQLVLNHCDVMNNRAALAEGGIFLNGNTNITVKNSIFKDQVRQHIWFQNYSSASVSYSDFYGPFGPFSNPPAGLGTLSQTNTNGDSCDVFYNTFLDPLFVDFPNGDYHLTENSPCIDTGDPASPYDPDGTITDMGRYFFDQGGTGIPGGYVSGTWTVAGSPYRILGNITIHADSSLTIEPGVVVDFQNFSFLQVNGFLEAVGSENDSILFNGAYWQGIAFENAPDSSRLTYCIVQNVEDWYSPLYGGITCMNSNPVISHCRISNNQGSSELWGAGGIMLYNSNAKISWCNISSNTIAYGFSGTGGGIKIRDSHPIITGCTIIDNYGDYRGGGIDMFGNSSLTIGKCTITGNECRSDGSGGGGIASQGSDLTVTECKISYNVGGPHGGGGIWITGGTGCDLLITGSTLDSNRASFHPPGLGPGGGIYADCDTFLVDHCTFIDNMTGDDVAAIGWAIHTEGNTSLILTNSILKGRGAFDRLVGIFGATASISYSNFYQYWMPFWGSLTPGLGELTQVNANGDSCDIYSNIFLDPLFADPANDDYHLTWANWPVADSTKSPCIDAGDPTTPPDPDNTVADMGRYYYDQGMPVISLSDSLLDFGEVIIGQQNDLPLTIRNFGTGILHLQNVINHHSEFTHNWKPADSLVLPGDSLIFTVTFIPVDTNLIIDTLLIENNDKPLQVQLSGKGKIVVGIEGQNELPRVYALYPAYPNPFNPITHISFDLPRDSKVALVVYDILGRKVSILVNKPMSPGKYEVTWNAENLPSGLYFYRFEAGEYIDIRKMILMK